MEKETVRERLISFLNVKEISQSKFEAQCGFSKGYVGSINNNMGLDKVQIIAEQFPEINKNWLMFGEGDMLLPNDKCKYTPLQRLSKVVYWCLGEGLAKSQKELALKMNYNDTYFSQIMAGGPKAPKVSDKVMQNLASLDPRINLSWLRTEYGSMIKSEDELHTPKYHLLNLLEYTKLASLRQLAQQIGCDPQNLYDINNGKVKAISMNIATKIIDYYPEINIGYLTDCEGEMLRNFDKPKAASEPIVAVFDKVDVPEDAPEDSIPEAEASETASGADVSAIIRQNNEFIALATAAQENQRQTLATLQQSLLNQGQLLKNQEQTLAVLDKAMAVLSGK